jgi:hypothetical protein
MCARTNLPTTHQPPSPSPQSVLDGRALSAVPAAVGTGLPRLTKLWLSNNGIRSLAPEIGDLIHLDSL